MKTFTILGIGLLGAGILLGLGDWLLNSSNPFAPSSGGGVDGTRTIIGLALVVGCALILIAGLNKSADEEQLEVTVRGRHKRPVYR